MRFPLDTRQLVDEMGNIGSGKAQGQLLLHNKTFPARVILDALTW
jgi:hypothetical protein